MLNVPLQQAPYLREQRQFPNEDLKDLSNQMDHTYIDIASKVNARIIGTFANSFQIITGETWYLNGSNQKQQTLRQVYNFGAIAPGTELDIPHGITNFTAFTRIYGVVTTDLPDYRPLPYIDPATLTTGMALLVGPGTVAPNIGVPCIRIVLGATARPVTSGIVVLEWLSQF